MPQCYFINIFFGDSFFHFQIQIVKFDKIKKFFFLRKVTCMSVNIFTMQLCQYNYDYFRLIQNSESSTHVVKSDGYTYTNNMNVVKHDVITDAGNKRIRCNIGWGQIIRCLKEYNF